MNIVSPVSLATFAAVFCALYAAHSVGDHWVQTHSQACGKGAPTAAGRLACARHVATLTLTKTAAVAALALVTGLTLTPLAVVAGLGVDAVSHYWADRRVTLARLAERLGKGDFHRLGAPRPRHDGCPASGHRRLRPGSVLAHRVVVHRRSRHRRGCVMKKYTVVDDAGRPVAEAGLVDAALWARSIRRSGTPLRVERTDACPVCGLHRCGGGPCAES